MVPPNRLEISPKVTAVRFGSHFAVKFPYDEAAVRLARNRPGSHWDPGMKSWCMSRHDIARVMEVMEQIHGALCAAGKDSEEDREPKAWVDWTIVKSKILPQDTENLEVGALIAQNGRHIVIAKIGDPHPSDETERLSTGIKPETSVCRVWYRDATSLEVRAHHEKLNDNDGPEM